MYPVIGARLDYREKQRRKNESNRRRKQKKESE